MDQVIVWLQEGISFFIPMVVLLGLLIFVHELGHFLVAKYFKVRVEVFSLGFGPKLFKFQRGDTVYAISAIPLGGYVKMFGDDPTAEIPPDQAAGSFTAKPVGQRIAVVLAGPLMNFFFAILLFMCVALVGEPTLAPQLGDIEEDTAAYQAGFRSGDMILQVGGTPVLRWEGMQSLIENYGDQQIEFVVRREGATETSSLKVTPKTVDNKNVLSWEKKVGEIQGLSYSSRASVIGVSDPQSAAAQAGMKTGDIVTAINGTDIGKWRQLLATIDKTRTATQAEPIRFKVQRLPDDFSEESTGPKKEPQTLDITVPANAGFAQATTSLTSLNALGIEYPGTFLAGFDKKSPAKEAGLKIGDKIVGIDGQAVQTFDEVAKIIRAYNETKNQAAEVKDEAATAATTDQSTDQSPDRANDQAGSEERPLRIDVLRGGQAVQVAVKPHFKNRMNNLGREENRFEIGIKPMIMDAMPNTFEWQISNPLAALERGVQQTAHWTSLTVLSFVRLFQAQVSAKNIGGFISIGQMAKKSWQIGASQFMNIMAIISINLFILNLLPVPVLDGGHLVFFTIEALRGAPLSLRKLEIAQQVGLILLLGLMVFALFNDVSRLFN